jgi:hypothetical protein
MSRYYRIEEAEAALPQVEASIERAIVLKADLEEAEQSLGRLRHRIHMMGGSMPDRGEFASIRERRDRSALELTDLMETVQSYGCLVKDLDIGLLDFPTLYRGEEVYLCWKLGEPAILFWHGVSEGFRGRKLIDADFRANHRGSAVS